MLKLVDLARLDLVFSSFWAIFQIVLSLESVHLPAVALKFPVEGNNFFVGVDFRYTAQSLQLGSIPGSKPVDCSSFDNHHYTKTILQHKRKLKSFTFTGLSPKFGRNGSNSLEVQQVLQIQDSAFFKKMSQMREICEFPYLPFLRSDAK